MPLGLMDLLKMTVAQKLVKGAEEGFGEIAGAGGVEGKEKEQEPAVVSPQLTNIEQAKQAAMAGGQALASQAVESNLEETLGMENRPLDISDAAKKRLIGSLKKKQARGKPITDADKRELQNALDRYEAAVDAGTITTPHPESLEQDVTDIREGASGGKGITKDIPGGRGDMEEINRQLSLASKGHLLGQLLAGTLAIAGGAGGVGPQAQFGFDPSSAGKVVSGITSQAYLEKKRALSRTMREKEEAILDRRIESIEAAPGISEPDKQRLIAGERRTFEVKMNRMNQTLGLGPGDVSDKNLKVVKPCGRTVVRMLRSDIELSDEDWKEMGKADPMEVVRGYLQEGGPWSKEELCFIHNMAKEASGDDYKYDVKDAGIWSPETLDGYARFIKNSVYTYKPEAMEIDPEIDPTEQHIGPMAQEIEKVNPACIVETPEGVKTVDTGRLALMNAGAIGDLARQADQQNEAIMAVAKQLANLVKAAG